MVRHRGKRIDESGQGMVEGTLACIVLTLVFIGALYLAFAGYSLNAAATAVQAASWNVDPAELVASGNKADVLEKAITDAVPGSTARNVKVKDVQAVERRETEGTDHAYKGDGLTVYQQRKLVDVSFTVSYASPAVPWATFTRQVEHTMVESQTAEVGA